MFLDRPNSLDLLGPIDKGSHNAPRSKGVSSTLSEEDRLDDNVLVTLCELMSTLQDSQIY